MSNLDIITIGEGLVELSSPLSLAYADTLDKFYGGDTLATAVAASRLGSKVGYISRVANDSFKGFLLDGWSAEGLDISHIKCMPGHNGLYFVTGHETGTKQYAYYRKKTAATMLSDKDIDEEYVKTAKIVYATGITQSISISAREAVLKLLKTAKENNLTTAFDPNFDSLLWTKEEAREAFTDIEGLIDILFLNLKSDSLELWEIESIDKLIELSSDRGVKTLVIKSKENKGYYLTNSSETTFLPFYSDIKTDSTGAGDVFNGAFLHEIAKGSTNLHALKVASVVAGLQVHGIGAIKSIPSYKEVAEVLKEQNEEI